MIIQALARGAKTVTEAAADAYQRQITVVGWIIARGENLKKAQYFITDRKTELLVKPWLPLEAVKGLVSRSGPRLMSDVVRKPVVLKGSVKRSGAGRIFQVKQELGSD